MGHSHTHRALVLSLCAWALCGCANGPQHLNDLNASVNRSVTYKHYYGWGERGKKPLKPGESGNCVAIAYTKLVKLREQGQIATMFACKLHSGEGHAVVLAEGWVLDNRSDWVYPAAQLDCE